MIKIQLNRIGNNYPAIPVIIDDSSYYDVETEQAVRKFQEIFNLPINGIVDKATWYKIKYFYNAVKKISDLYSEGITLDEATLIFPQQLELGSTGQYIRTLNYLLNVISYFDSDIPFLDLKSETFNENTKQVVIAFQNKYNLPATGVVDATTWKDLVYAYQQTLRLIPKEYFANISEFYPGRVLVRGMTGDDVTRLQRFLYIICEKTHNIPGVVVNGRFDSLTEQSVKTIQKRYSLNDDGAVGAATWYHIVELTKEVS